MGTTERNYYFLTKKYLIMAKKISMSYKSLNEAGKIAFAFNVLQLMLTNEAFSSLLTQINNLKVLLSVYQIAAAEAVNKGKDRIATKNQCLSAVIDQLDDLVAYVNILAKKDESLIGAAGLSTIETSRPRKTTELITALATPIGINAVNVEQAGVVTVSWNEAQNVLIYVIAEQVGDSTEWVITNYSDTHEGILLKGYPQGKNVRFRVMAVTGDNVQSNWSALADVWVS